MKNHKPIPKWVRWFALLAAVWTIAMTVDPRTAHAAPAAVDPPGATPQQREFVHVFSDAHRCMVANVQALGTVTASRQANLIAYLTTSCGRPLMLVLVSHGGMHADEALGVVRQMAEQTITEEMPR